MIKWKKILLWTGIIAAILIVVVIVLPAGYSWMLGKQIERRLAALQAAGEPTCLADLARKPIPPEQNGATYLLRAKIELESAVKEIYQIKNFPENCCEPEEIKVVHNTLQAYPQVYPLLQQAAACEDFAFDLDFTLPPQAFMQTNLDHAEVLVSVRRFLEARALDWLFQGKNDEALQATVLLLKLARLVERGPLLLVNYQICISLEARALDCVDKILRAGPVSDESRAALDAELALLGSRDILQTTLKGERAYSLDCFRRELPRPWILFNQWQQAVLNLFEEFLNYSLYPYSVWAGKNEALEARSGAVLGANIMAELLRPALRETLIASYCSGAQVRAIRIINALQMKVPPESDVVPSMKELGLPEEIGIDPFNGKPLIIKKLPQGWQVYSVGKNLQDDGGDFTDNRDVGFGPKKALKGTARKNNLNNTCFCKYITCRFKLNQ